MLEFQFIQGRDTAEKRGAAARNNPFLNARAGRVHGVFNLVFLRLQLCLGGRTGLDEGNSAGQLRQAFLKLFLVVVGGGVLDLLFDLGARFSTSFLSPPPAIIVVFSLSTITFLAVPRCFGLFPALHPALRRWPCRRSRWQCPAASPCGDHRSRSLYRGHFKGLGACSPRAWPGLPLRRLPK